MTSDVRLLYDGSMSTQQTVRRAPVAPHRQQAGERLNVHRLFESRWFHATTVPNWLERVRENGALVHIGSRESAIHRSQRVTAQGLRRVEDHTLYEVIISDATVFNPVVSEDTNDWVEDTCDMFHNALAYENDHEDTGVVSLLIDPAYLEVREVSLLPRMA